MNIGPNAVVAAGAVVNKDEPSGTIVGGVPAKQIGTIDELLARMEKRTAELSWADLIKNRKDGFDPTIESELHDGE